MEYDYETDNRNWEAQHGKKKYLKPGKFKKNLITKEDELENENK